MSLICRCHRLITAIIRQQSLSTHIIFCFTRTLCPVRNDVTKELIQTIQHGSVCWPLDLCLRGSLFSWQQSGNNIHTWTQRHILKRWTYLKLTFWYLERQAEFKNVCEDLSNLQTLEHLQEDKSVNSEYYHLCFLGWDKMVHIYATSACETGLIVTKYNSIHWVGMKLQCWIYVMFLLRYHRQRNQLWSFNNNYITNWDCFRHIMFTGIKSLIHSWDKLYWWCNIQFTWWNGANEDLDKQAWREKLQAQ